MGGWTINGVYSFGVGSGQQLGFGGTGIAVNSGSVNLNNNGTVDFYNNSTAGPATLTNNTNTSIITFHNNSTAGSSSITNNGSLSFNDQSTAGTASIDSDGLVTFNNTSTAGQASISNNGPSGELSFNDSSTAGAASIINTGSVQFTTQSSAGSSSITNNATLAFVGNSTAGTSKITNNNGAEVDFFDLSTAGSSSIKNFGVVHFYNSSTGGTASITNNSALVFFDTSSAGASTITNNGVLAFLSNSTAGTSTITNNNGLSFQDQSSAGASTIINSTGAVKFYNTSSAASSKIINNSYVYFNDQSTAAAASIINNGGLAFFNTSTAGSSAIINNGNLAFTDQSTAGAASIINNNFIQFLVNASGGNAAIVNNDPTAITEFSQTSGPGGLGRVSVGSIAGAGTFFLGGNTLTVGGNNQSTTVTGVITDGGLGGGSGASLVKSGTATLTLSGINAYTGTTTIAGGTLQVNGSIAASSGVTVDAGATLAGTGTVSSTLVNAGGTLAPGNGAAGTSLAISGNLAMASGAMYLVQLNASTASSANIKSTAQLGGATVDAVFASGSVAKTYTILTAGSISGTFASSVMTNNPNLSVTPSYDANHVYLNVALTFAPPPGGQLSGNQQTVGNALVNAFNTSGGIPLVYTGLTAAGLTQASGELATGSQQTTFDAMGLFMGLLTDPFMRERGCDPRSGFPEYGARSSCDPNRPSAQGFAEESEGVSAYAASKRTDAFAMFTKAPPRASFEQRWSVWAAGFGGSQRSEGNAVVGSNNTTSRIFGVAAGADYLFSPNTLAGFALAGGGTNFGVNGLGSGRSDLFQAGAYVRHWNGPAYVTAALAYGWQDITTDRTVTIAGVDHLRAEFNANTWAGRLEGGYRFIAPWTWGFGITPYAAAQFTTFQLPSYAEQVISGSNAFALSYAGKSVTDTRTELGLRTDKSWAMPNGIFTLRGRFAWAHDFDPDRSIAATFQALPGASFVVNGAAHARDSALTTASAEWKWLTGWSAAATFEGEFSNLTRSYAGKGVVRYTW